MFSPCAPKPGILFDLKTQTEVIMNYRIASALLVLAMAPLGLAGCVSPQEGFAMQKPTTSAQRQAIVAGARDTLKDPYSLRDVGMGTPYVTKRPEITVHGSYIARRVM